MQIDLPDELDGLIASASAAERKLVSVWVADVVRKRLGLPTSELLSVFGSVPDLELPTRSEPWSHDE